MIIYETLARSAATTILSAIFHFLNHTHIQKKKKNRTTTMITRITMMITNVTMITYHIQISNIIYDQTSYTYTNIKYHIWSYIIYIHKYQISYIWYMRPEQDLEQQLFYRPGPPCSPQVTSSPQWSWWSKRWWSSGGWSWGGWWQSKWSWWGAWWQLSGL